MVRKKMFTIRMNEIELARLKKIASHYVINSAGVFRLLMKREADMLLQQKISGAS